MSLKEARNNRLQRLCGIEIGFIFKSAYLQPKSHSAIGQSDHYLKESGPKIIPCPGIGPGGEGGAHWSTCKVHVIFST